MSVAEDEGHTVSVQHNPRKRRMKFARSKGGCAPCRKQKKKCDQARPRCGRCVDKDRRCVYTGKESGLSLSRDTAHETPEFQGGSSIVSPPSAPTITSITTSNGLLGVSSAAAGGGIDWSHLTFPEPLPVSQPSQTISLPENTRVDESLRHAMFQAGNTHTPPDQAASSSDTFLQAFFGADTLLPIPSSSPLDTALAGQQSSTSQPYCALLSLPLDYGSSAWSSFAEGEDWMTREIEEGENGPLMEYFMKIASTTIVVRDVPTAAGRFYTDLARMASADGQSALMHAVLCVSAQHLANWSQKAGDVTKALTFGDRACRHKLEAINLLRRSNDDSDSLSPAVMVMLALSANLKGEADIIPSFLNRTTYFLGRVVRPSSHPSLPSVAAIHSVYVGLHSMSVGEETNLDSLFKSWDDSPAWTQQAEQVCSMIYGVHKNMLTLLLRVNQMVIQAGKLFETAVMSPTNMERNMAQLELEAEASVIRTELRDETLFDARYRRGSMGIGNELYRLAVIVMILTGIFVVPSGHPRIVDCVDELLKHCQRYIPGMEIGILWPIIIIASEAEGQQRRDCMAFIEQCQWKGSYGPQWTETIVRTVWKTRDAGQPKTWREVVATAGSPLII